MQRVVVFLKMARAQFSFSCAHSRLGLVKAWLRMIKSPPRSQSRLEKNISKWRQRWRTLWHIEVSETLSLSYILRLVCVRGLESLGKNMQVRNFLSLLPFKRCLKVLLVARPSIEFSVSSIRLDHSRLYAFVDRQESYVLLSSPSRC